MGWLSPNHEYLKGLRDGMLVSQKIIEENCHDEMMAKGLKSKIVEYSLKIGHMLEWLK